MFYYYLQKFCFFFLLRDTKGMEPEERVEQVEGEETKTGI